MKLKYRIKLKGTNCYLKNTGAKSVNFTTDVNKAKVFEKEYGRTTALHHTFRYKPSRRHNPNAYNPANREKFQWPQYHFGHSRQYMLPFCAAPRDWTCTNWCSGQRPGTVGGRLAALPQPPALYWA